MELVNHPYCNSGADQSLDRQTKICRPALWNEPIFIGRMIIMIMVMIMIRNTMMMIMLMIMIIKKFPQLIISVALSPLVRSPVQTFHL